MVHASKPLTSGKIQSYFRDEYSSASNSYFTQGGTLKGHWHGQLASALGLSGDVTPRSVRPIVRRPASSHWRTAHPTSRHHQNAERGRAGPSRRLGLHLQCAENRQFDGNRWCRRPGTPSAWDGRAGRSRCNLRIMFRHASVATMPQRRPASGLPPHSSTIQHGPSMGIRLPISTRTSLFST